MQLEHYLISAYSVPASAHVQISLNKNGQQYLIGIYKPDGTWLCATAFPNIYRAPMHLDTDGSLLRTTLLILGIRDIDTAIITLQRYASEWNAKHAAAIASHRAA